MTIKQNVSSDVNHLHIKLAQTFFFHDPNAPVSDDLIYYFAYLINATQSQRRIPTLSLLKLYRDFISSSKIRIIEQRTVYFAKYDFDLQETVTDHDELKSGFEVIYFRMPDVSARDQLKKLLRHYREFNPGGLKKQVKNGDTEVEKLNYFDSQTVHNSSFLQTLKGASFHLIITGKSGELIDVLTVERIFTMLLDIKNFKEQAGKIFDGEVGDKILVSGVVLPETDLSRVIRESTAKDGVRFKYKFDLDFKNYKSLYFWPNLQCVDLDQSSSDYKEFNTGCKYGSDPTISLIDL